MKVRHVFEFVPHQFLKTHRERMFGLFLGLLFLTKIDAFPNKSTDNYITNYYLRSKFLYVFTSDTLFLFLCNLDPWLKYDAEKMTFTINFLIEKLRKIQLLSQELEAKMERDLMEYKLKKALLQTFLAIEI